MENNLLQLSVTEAVEVTDVCSIELRSPVCPMTQIGTILMPCDAITHKKKPPFRYFMMKNYSTRYSLRLQIQALKAY